MMAPIVPVVGRGLASCWMQFGQPQIIAAKPCPKCDGKGVIMNDFWVGIVMYGDANGRMNLGHTLRCHACDATGRIVTAIYTRGVSLTPISERRK